MKHLYMEQDYSKQYSKSQHSYLPIALFLTMVCAFFLLDAVLPLQDLMFPDALLTHLGKWPLSPAHVLFPRFPVVQMRIDKHVPAVIMLARSWKETGLLFGVFLGLFGLYLLALRLLPQTITFRYILISTLLLGIICVLIPVVTSSDVFSYIAYARMGVIYHLNPLTALPVKISADPVFRHLYWIKQPSIYGPTWIAITYFLQWLTLSFGLPGILSMLLALRLFGLAMHLGSTLLIWLISGHLQLRSGFITPEKRLRATLAFAWNPLLLLEACVNAHVDVTILFFVLLAIWFLVRNWQTTTRRGGAQRVMVQVAAMLAIATCLKLNVVLLALGLLFFLWTQPGKIGKLLTFTATYCGIIALLYVPFWQGGALLHTFKGTPAASQNINTLPDFLSRLYNAIAADFGRRVVAPDHQSPSVYVTHTLSVSIFVILFAVLCWRTMRRPERINSIPGLIRWLALVWLLYCAVGSPWFWPWYLVTFFGLYALIEATSSSIWSFNFLGLPLDIRILVFSMLSMYCFYTWAPLESFVPGLPGFLWTEFRGLYVWTLPLLVVYLHVAAPSQRGKLPETKWQEVWAFLSRSVQPLKNPPQM